MILGRGARWPEIPLERGGTSEGGVAGYRTVADDGLDVGEGGEEAGVHEGEEGEL